MEKIIPAARFSLQFNQGFAWVSVISMLVITSILRAYERKCVVRFVCARITLAVSRI